MKQILEATRQQARHAQLLETHEQSLKNERTRLKAFKQQGVEILDLAKYREYNLNLLLWVAILSVLAFCFFFGFMAQHHAATEAAAQCILFAEQAGHSFQAAAEACL